MFVNDNYRRLDWMANAVQACSLPQQFVHVCVTIFVYFVVNKFLLCFLDSTVLNSIREETCAQVTDAESWVKSRVIEVASRVQSSRPHDSSKQVEPLTTEARVIMWVRENNKQSSKPLHYIFSTDGFFYFLSYSCFYIHGLRACHWINEWMNKWMDGRINELIKWMNE